MKKSDLKDGLIVTLRGGEECLVVGNMLIKNNFRFSMSLNSFNEDLTHKESKYSDIVKVQQLNKECVLWERKEVDWSKVPVDTKVLVSDGGKHWYKRYFVKYRDGMYHTFPDGLTSWSVNEENGVVKWKYCKLAEEPKEEVTEKELKKEFAKFCKAYGITCRGCKFSKGLKEDCRTLWILENYNVTRKDNK